MRYDHETIEKLARVKQKPVYALDGKEMAEILGAVKYVECSARTQQGVKNVFDEAILAAEHEGLWKRFRKLLFVIGEILIGQFCCFFLVYCEWNIKSDVVDSFS